MRDDDTTGTDTSPMSLMVVYRDGIQLVPLPRDEEVTIGRSEPADIQCGSRRLSRVHAAFWWDGRDVRVRDLRSTNGTLLNGRSIQTGTLGPEDEVTVGSVTITLHSAGTMPDGLLGVLTHEDFVERVESEVERARTFGRGLAVTVIRAFSGKGRLARWVPRVQRGVRRVDAVGLYSSGALELMLAEADADEARNTLRSLVMDRAPNEPPLVAGFAVYPQHGASAESLLAAATEAVAAATLVDPVLAYQHEPESGSIDDEGQPVIRNPQMVEVWRTLDRVASAAISVLIVGETGVGKEVVARGIHERSPRHVGPLKSINCGAIPATLLESVLFGHERGAFTGADRQRPGVFEEASGGTVFLDEVGELAPAAQVALLRVLDAHTVIRVGGADEIDVDVRVLAATHRDLEAMCRAGHFRWDLYYRLATMTLRIPPLRDRVDEIRPLVRRFVDDANMVNHRKIRGATPAALAALEVYPWPGNVRELRNVVDRAVVIATGAHITIDDLPANLRNTTEVPEPDDFGDNDEATDPGGELVEPLKPAVAQLERRLICRALAACDGNQTRAAEVLAMSRRTLVYKIRGYGIGEEFRRARPLRVEGGDRASLADLVASFERSRIARALELAEGRRAAAAVLLDIQKRTLDQKMARYGLDSALPESSNHRTR